MNIKEIKRKNAHANAKKHLTVNFIGMIQMKHMMQFRYLKKKKILIKQTSQ